MTHAMTKDEALTQAAELAIASQLRLLDVVNKITVLEETLLRKHPELKAEYESALARVSTDPATRTNRTSTEALSVRILQALHPRK
jgi:hypothetical protein